LGHKAASNVADPLCGNLLPLPTRSIMRALVALAKPFG
jgi:hypothetical protein